MRRKPRIISLLGLLSLVGFGIALAAPIRLDVFGWDDATPGPYVIIDPLQKSPPQIQTEAPADPPPVETEAPPPRSEDHSRQLTDLCRGIDDKLTSVSFKECMAADLDSSGVLSNLENLIAVRDFQPSGAEAAGRVLLVGGIHGDEYSSVTIVFKWLSLLERQRGGNFHWRVVPLLNPDGLLMPEGESQRMNANGVDLNRNFPTPNWETEAMDYWVNRTRKSKRRYPGEAPLSEPESRWLSGQVDTYQPDAVISVHAPHGIVDFDGPRVPPDSLGPLELRLLGTYPGSMGRYIGVYKGIPLLTIELESASRVPDREDMDRIWFDMMDWLNAKVAPDTKMVVRPPEADQGEQKRVSDGRDDGRSRSDGEG